MRNFVLAKCGAHGTPHWYDIYDVHCIVTHDSDLIELAVTAFKELVNGDVTEFGKATARFMQKSHWRSWKRRLRKLRRTNRAAPNTKKTCFR